MQYNRGVVKNDWMDAKMRTITMDSGDKTKLLIGIAGGVIALLMLGSLFCFNKEAPVADALVTTSTVGCEVPDVPVPAEPAALVIQVTATTTSTTSSTLPRSRSTSTSTLRKERTPTVPGNCNSCGGDRVPTRLTTLTATTTLHGVVVSEFPMPLSVIILLSLFCLFTVEWKRWVR